MIILLILVFGFSCTATILRANIRGKVAHRVQRNRLSENDSQHDSRMSAAEDHKKEHPSKVKSTDEDFKRGLPPVEKTLQTFDFFGNLNYTFSQHVKSGNTFYLRAVDGLKFFLYLGMLIQSEYAKRNGFTQLLADDMGYPRNRNSFTWRLVTASVYLSDIFLCLSGLVNAISLLKKFKKGESGVGFYFRSVARRYLRLVVANLVVTLVFWQILPGTVSGPSNHLISEYTQHCKKGWFSQVTLVGNLFQNQTQCMDWTWYLCVDFQCFLVLPLLVMILRKNKKLALGSVIVLSLLIFHAAGFIFYGESLSMIHPNQTWSERAEFMKYYFTQAYTRGGSYFLGVYAGMRVFLAIRHRSNRLRNSVIHTQKYKSMMTEDGATEEQVLKTLTSERRAGAQLALTFAGLGLVSVVVVIYFQYMKNFASWSTGLQAFFMPLSSLLVTGGILLLLAPSFLNWKSFAHNFLGSKIWRVFARIGLNFYLWHLVFIYWALSSSENTNYYDSSLLDNYIAGDYVIIFVISVIFTALVDLPAKAVLNSAFVKKSREETLKPSQDSGIEELQD